MSVSRVICIHADFRLQLLQDIVDDPSSTVDTAELEDQLVCLRKWMDVLVGQSESELRDSRAVLTFFTNVSQAHILPDL